MQTQIDFRILDEPEGGLAAKTLGESIFTQADSIEPLNAAPRRHFPDECTRPKPVRPHRVLDEVIAA
jgi:hypothetical protein